MTPFSNGRVHFTGDLESVNGSLPLEVKHKEDGQSSQANGDEKNEEEGGSKTKFETGEDVESQMNREDEEINGKKRKAPSMVYLPMRSGRISACLRRSTSKPAQECEERFISRRLKYIVKFAKSSSLSDNVQLMCSLPSQPLWY